MVVGGKKGGTGKTTIAVNLAAMRMKDKGDTILVDAEPTQQNSSLWCLSREDSGIQPRITSMSKLGKTLRNDLLKLGEKFSTVIVDTGGQDSTELRASLLAADVVVSPMRPSQFDIWTLDRMNKLVGDARQVNESMRAYILLNAAHTNPLVDETKESIQYFIEKSEKEKKEIIFLRIPKSLHDDLERICNLTGYKKNMFCLQVLIEAARDKLKQIERET